jgi:hypothetical protein
MNALRIVGAIAAFVVMTVLGLAAGWFARSQTLAATGPIAGHADGEAPTAPAELFSDRALKNMGITCTQAVKSDFVVCRDVLGIIEEIPTSLRSVSARWGGTVSAVLPVGETGSKSDHGSPVVVAGRLLKPGETVVEILRAPMPLITRTMTGDVVQMVSETVHDSAVQLRASRQLLELSKMEYERVRDLNRDAPGGLPVIPRQTEINLQYDMVKARTEVERLSSRLFLHGFTNDQIEAAGKGAPLLLTADVWKRALERNGLWPATGERILAKLPASLRAHPWTYAALGELEALGKCDEAMVAAIGQEPALGARFHEATALLQTGHSLEDVLAMVREHALDPVIRVKVPSGAPVWEVRELRVKPGDTVEAGGVLAVLADSRHMALELQSSGVDTALIETALRDGIELEGRPLVTGAGPALKGLRLTAYNTPHADEGGHEPRAYAVVANERLLPPAGNGGPPTGAWRLRPGMRYRVRVPVRCHEDVFAFPRDALVTEGAERLIFLRSGTSFRRQPVRLLHEDPESIVVADDGAVFPNDPVVTSGAFALSLALRAEATGSAGTSHAPGKHGPTCQH